MTLPECAHSGLLTDLYQFTMTQGYLEYDLEETAVFELFMRKLPPTRNFLVAAGLEQFLSYLVDVRFSSAEIEWLSTQGFGPKLLEYLSHFRFTGDVHALPEGTIFFPDEPILRVTAPLPQAQLLETRAINLLHFQTLIASKAVRMVLAAPGSSLVDFGLRRAHGAEAGLLAARACYLAGFAGTATVLAGQQWGIPTFGTMAHAFVEAHPDENEAFEHFAVANPGRVTFILDTYDTEAAAHKVVALARKLATRGIAVRGVRLDSGDLAEHARRVRRILDDGGQRDIQIVASGGLEEQQLAELVRRGAPIDSYGIGTRLDVSSDAPYLDCAYKLVEYGGQPRRKHSEGKASWPGRKQVVRRLGSDGLMSGDAITLADEPAGGGEALVVPFVEQGRPVDRGENLDTIRRRLAEQLTQLPAKWKSLEPAPPYPVHVSPALRELAARFDREHGLPAGK